MGTQTGVVKFKGKIGNLRGYTKSDDIKGRAFIGNKGGSSLVTFNTSKKMGVVRNYASEFQGCVQMAFDMYNFAKGLFHMRGLQFKQNVYKILYNTTQLVSGTFGQRPLAFGLLNIFNLPFQIGTLSFAQIFTSAYSIAWDALGVNYVFTLPSFIPSVALNYNKSATHYRFVLGLYTMDNWQVDPHRNNKYFPVDANYVTQRGITYEPAEVLDNTPVSFSITCTNSGPAKIFGNAMYAMVGIETGKLINGIFYPDVLKSGSSILNCLF